jgi:ABC-2 type transport system permease protein
MTTMQATPTTVGGTGTAGSADRLPGVPLGRLVLVELRKLADTRAGMWLLLIVGLAGVATSVIMLAAAPDAEQTFAALFTFGLVPGSVLLPVLGILSMTGEWSQRTALTTFTLVPARGRVIAAKLLAAVAVAVAATAVTAVIAALGNLVAIAMDGDGSWTISGALVAQSVLLEVIFVLMGSAFGALLLNSPLAIVLYFALPTVWTVLGEMVRWLRTAAGWVDINVTSMPLTADDMTGGQWARLGVSVAVWVLLPLVAGTVRVLRREVS